MNYECEDCNREIEGEPEYSETVPGYEDPITLYFCEKCVEEPAFRRVG